MPTKLYDILDFIKKQVSLPELEGHFFRWHLEDEGFTYGWFVEECTSSNGYIKLATEKNYGKCICFLSFRIDSTDNVVITDVKLGIVGGKSIFSVNETDDPFYQLKLVTRGFSGYSPLKCIQLNIDDLHTGAVTISAIGEIRFEGDDKGPMIEDEIYLL